MQIKIQLIGFITAVIVFVARMLIAKEDKQGNIYIKSPAVIMEEIKSGYRIFKEYFRTHDFIKK